MKCNFCTLLLLYFFLLVRLISGASISFCTIKAMVLRIQRKENNKIKMIKIKLEKKRVLGMYAGCIR